MSAHNPTTAKTYPHTRARLLSSRAQREVPNILRLALASLILGVCISLTSCSERDETPTTIAPAERTAASQNEAATGDAEVQNSFGVMYRDGQGVPKDASKAVTFFQKAAAQGNASAQVNLGLMYANGEGVPKDMAQATNWYQKSAAQGLPNAELALAGSYYLGKGVAHDLVLAYAWTNIAAASSDTDIAQQADRARTWYEQHIAQAEVDEGQRLSSAWKPGVLISRANDQTNKENAVSSETAVPKEQSTGTLFVVSTSGLAITNEHVTHECKELHLEGRSGIASVITADAVNDLALVQIPGQVADTATIAKEPEKIRQGDDVVVFGFPLNSVLSSGGNLTPGVISAITGLGNNTNQIQITAPIQPGSSGSPVMNRRGDVIGVVSAKLSDSAMATATGGVGQNVNFAVSGQTLKAFLDANHVAYTSQADGWLSRDKALPDIATEARKWTLIIECWK